jgi:hypothetical protein
MQNILFSVYCGLTVSVCYKMSRGSSNPVVLWHIVKQDILKIKSNSNEHDEVQDPLPSKLKKIVVSYSSSCHFVTQRFCCF